MQSLAVHRSSGASSPGGAGCVMTTTTVATRRSSAALTTLIQTILTADPHHQTYLKSSKTQTNSRNMHILDRLKHLIAGAGGKMNKSQHWQHHLSLLGNRTYLLAASKGGVGVGSPAFNLMKLLIPYYSMFWWSSHYLPTPRLVLDKIELAAQRAAVKALHLITAHSGYSKEYLNNTYNTNIRSTRIDMREAVAMRNSNSRLTAPNSAASVLNTNRKGCIGDDAWFIVKQAHSDVLGVADGVGGWHEYGIDPSKFSFNLMKTCKRLVEQQPTNAKITSETPLELLEQSYQTLLEDKNNSYLVGSSTACILLFHRDTNLLHTCNLGDSGFVIVRSNRIIHRSQEQQHYFNSPYQIAILPPQSKVTSNAAAAATAATTATATSTATSTTTTVTSSVDRSEEESLISDTPEAAINCSIELKEGDFIVMGTDGLWDNLNESHLLVEISKIKNYMIDDLQKAANNIARKAIELALDPNYISPFAKAARKYGINISGGKPDDITVILARVSTQLQTNIVSRIDENK